MKFKYLVTVIALTAINTGAFAQYSQDAIRYSTFQTGSTSRIKAIGNAGTAIGGDLTNISGNPAGLGFFTRSEVSITPEFDGSSVSSNYLGQQHSATKSAANLNNAAILFYSRLNTPSGYDKNKGWLNLNFGLGYNRTNDYGENIYYSGKNNSSSINDYYASLANTDGLTDGTLQSWAYNHSLIDQYGTPNPTYKSNSYPGVNQIGNLSRSGGESDFDLSMGANYSNKLYLGLGIGFANFQYTTANSFNETGVASVLENSIAVDRNFNSTFSQNQDTKGEGFNAKIGIIYKLLENVRLGAVITTPTYFSIEDSYNESLATSLSNGNKYADGPASYPLSYSMHTPWKASGGLSVFFGKYGFISGDVEYVDYSTTRINTNDDYDSSYDNGQIKSNYKAAVNAHVGAEIKLTNAIALRGGYGLQGSPLKTNGSSTQTATAGLGYRFGDYYFDVAYLHINSPQTVTPYNIGALSPSANLNAANNNVFLTFGFRY